MEEEYSLVIQRKNLQNNTTRGAMIRRNGITIGFYSTQAREGDIVDYLMKDRALLGQEQILVPSEFMNTREHTINLSKPSNL